jgi:nucleoside-diphosphate-sugar epimerase
VGKVALWGANGAIGKSIADALRASGRAYRVVGRNRESLAASFGSDPLAEITVWNPEDAASVRAAAEGIETIVYLVGVDYTRFDLHPILMQATLDGAIAAGVSNVLLIGTVYPYGLPQTATVRENHPRSPNSFKGQKRKEQEDLLLEADRAGRIHGAVLRLPDFYGLAVEKSIIGEAFTAARSGKTANLLGPIDTPHEFMFVPDVGPVVVRLIEEPRAWGKVWHLAGPGTTTQREMLAHIERVLGHPVKVRIANKTMLRAMGVFMPLMRELVEMHYLQTNPVILDDSALHELLGPIHKTSYDDGVIATVAASSTAP